jgi:hypothetical protein
MYNAACAIAKGRHCRLSSNSATSAATQSTWLGRRERSIEVASATSNGATGIGLSRFANRSPTHRFLVVIKVDPCALRGMGLVLGSYSGFNFETGKQQTVLPTQGEFFGSTVL